MYNVNVKEPVRCLVGVSKPTERTKRRLSWTETLILSQIIGKRIWRTRSHCLTRLNGLAMEVRWAPGLELRHSASGHGTGTVLVMI